MADNDNKGDPCECAVCAVGRLIDSKLSRTPKGEEVDEIFRGLAVGVAGIAAMNQQPVAVVQAFLNHLSDAITEMVPAALIGNAEAVPPANKRH